MSLVVENLTKRSGEKTAVDHLSFSMETPGVFAFWEPMEPERPQRSGQYWVSWKLMRGKPSGTAGKLTGRRWLSVICRRSAASI